jgi:hypothetical protein
MESLVGPSHGLWEYIVVTSNVSLTGKFYSNFNLKNIISTYTKVFFNGKNGPNPPDFNFKISKLPKSYDNF